MFKVIIAQGTNLELLVIINNWSVLRSVIPFVKNIII